MYQQRYWDMPREEVEFLAPWISSSNACAETSMAGKAMLVLKTCARELDDVVQDIRLCTDLSHLAY